MVNPIYQAKSSIVLQVAQELGIPVLYLNLAQETVPMTKQKNDAKAVDYGHLAGEPVTVTVKDETKVGKVVDAHYDVGITVVDAEDPNIELICMNRREYMMQYRSYPWGNEKVGQLDGWERAYDLDFYKLIEEIKAGHIEHDESWHEYLINEICGFSEEYSPCGSNCAWK